VYIPYVKGVSEKGTDMTSGQSSKLTTLLGEFPHENQEEKRSATDGTVHP
jgi:hypothetical protein